MQSRFKINNSNWRADAIDNIGLIINEIGYHTGYTSDIISLEVSNYKVKVPKEVVSVGKIRHNGTNLALANDRDSYDGYYLNKGVPKTASPEHVLELNKEAKRLDTLKELYLDTPTEEILIQIQDSQRKISKLVEGVTYNKYINGCGFNWYRLEGGYIKTSFESGTIEIDADIFMTDNEGLPMVIDTFKYTEACIWGILYYLLIGGYVHPVLTLNYVEGKKDFYVLQAQNEPKIMSIDRHQRFTEEWSTLARGINNETLNHI